MNKEGENAYNLIKEIFPIFRCLMGEGVRQTLGIIKREIFQNTARELMINSVPSGTKVFDWEIPKEWVIKEAYIEDESGNRLIDMNKNNLHVVGYSTSVDRWVNKEELLQYIYVQEDQPDVIPYVTSYYKEQYGFCMTKEDRDRIDNKRYHMVINSSFKEGSLTYGELVIPGDTDQEVFFSTYICHPSMANNECSGPAVAVELIKYLSSIVKRKYTYHFLFIPETIGAITYMATEQHLISMKEKIIAGVVLTCVGDNNAYSLVHSRYGNNLSERVLGCILKNKENYKEYSYLERGSDERQYCAPGVDLPFATFCRSKFHVYKEYHTSADDLSFISPEGLQGSIDILKDYISILEMNDRYSVTVLCEPQLGKRGLYPSISKKGKDSTTKIIQDLIAYLDGNMDLIEISEMIHVDIKTVIRYVKLLLDAGLL